MPSLESRCHRLGGSRSRRKNQPPFSLEALSSVDWYNRPPAHQARLHYYSDDDEDGEGDGKPASEVDDEEEDADDAKEDEAARNCDQQRKVEDWDAKCSGVEKLEAYARHGCAVEGSSEKGPVSLSAFSAQFVHTKPTVAGLNTSKDAQKSEKVPRTYAGAVSHTGNLLPHKGILLPSYMNMHHMGTHNSGTHSHNKGLTSTKAATLIPSHISGKPSKGSAALANGHEPSSPKVTCLGRIKIKQKYCREMGKLVAKGGQLDSGEGPMVEILGGSTSVPDAAEMKRLKQGNLSHKVAVTIVNPMSDPETKTKKGIRKTLKEATSHMKFYREKKKLHPPSASMALDDTSAPVETAIDLGRFRSVHAIQGQESRLPETVLSNEDGLHGTKFVPQVPPPNSLLLMRNSKSRGLGTTLSSSSWSGRTIANLSEHESMVDGKSDVNRQGCGSSSVSGMKLGEVEVTAVENRYCELEEKALLPELDVKRLCVAIAKECKPLDGRKDTRACHQVLLRKEIPESRLWQRRCVMKPSDLHIARPIALQVNRPIKR